MPATSTQVSTEMRPSEELTLWLFRDTECYAVLTHSVTMPGPSA